MIRFFKNKLLFLLLFNSFHVFAQDENLFDEKNNAAFARFLFQSSQYKYAAEEYARLSFMYPANQEYQFALLKSYRYANEFRRGISAFQALNSPGPEVQQEYARLIIHEGNRFYISSFLNELDKESKLRNDLDLTFRLISLPEHALSLEGIKLDIIDKGLMSLYNEASKIKHRSPFLAGTFSTLIPGTGKVYSGRWKDGLMSFIFVGTTAFQAYRGFDQKGTKSVYGWIMGGLSVGFYIGNIYGSARAAKIYNTNQYSAYVNKVTHYYIDHY